MSTTLREILESLPDHILDAPFSLKKKDTTAFSIHMHHLATKNSKERFLVGQEKHKNAFFNEVFLTSTEPIYIYEHDLSFWNARLGLYRFGKVQILLRDKQADDEFKISNIEVRQATGNYVAKDTPRFLVSGNMFCCEVKHGKIKNTIACFNDKKDAALLRQAFAKAWELGI